MDGYFRIGEVATGARVNVQTLRYYERRGLLPAPRRLASGYRAYPPDTVQTVRFIKQAQAHGFSLDEIKVLMHVDAGDGPGGCERARALATARIADLDQKIAELQRMRDALRQLADACERPHPDPRCPLTHAIHHRAE